MNFESVSDDKFIHFLKNELVRRIGKNSNYSLRSFAKACDLSPGALSSLMAKKRPLTRKAKDKIINSLGIGMEELEWLTDGKEYLPLDQLAILSDWYHFAILELTKVKGFKPDTHWVAKKFGLNIKEVELAVERLQKLGLLRIEKKKWVDTYSDRFLTNFDGKTTSQAHKIFQKQILEKSLYALENLPLEQRNHTGTTMAINTKNMPKAKKLIADFQNKFMELMEKDPKPNEVYHLHVSFQPLSKLDNKE